MHGACSIHEGLKYPLDGVKTSRVGLRSLGRKVNSESLCTPGDQPEKERERKQDTGTKALMEQRYFIQHCVGIYTVLQDSYFQQR